VHAAVTRCESTAILLPSSGRYRTLDARATPSRTWQAPELPRHCDRAGGSLQVRTPQPRDCTSGERLLVLEKASALRKRPRMDRRRAGGSSPTPADGCRLQRQALDSFVHRLLLCSVDQWAHLDVRARGSPPRIPDSLRAARPLRVGSGSRTRMRRIAVHFWPALTVISLITSATRRSTAILPPKRRSNSARFRLSASMLIRAE